MFPPVKTDEVSAQIQQRVDRPQQRRRHLPPVYRVDVRVLEAHVHHRRYSEQGVAERLERPDVRIPRNRDPVLFVVVVRVRRCRW